MQLGIQSGDFEQAAAPRNTTNAEPGTELMKHHTVNDTFSGGIGGDSSNIPQLESCTSSQPKATTNIVACGTGESNEHPWDPM